MLKTHVTQWSTACFASNTNSSSDKSDTSGNDLWDSIFTFSLKLVRAFKNVNNNKTFRQKKKKRWMVFVVASKNSCMVVTRTGMFYLV